MWQVMYMTDDVYVTLKYLPSEIPAVKLQVGDWVLLL